ncbi:MAG: phosphatidylserine/phosphatidylglycerophosphate/cardiolipin synthase family protein [Acidimicrobiaceae bacterium]|nr:phosphatidylserine/phosphatidylglycerophosphate/cardiolipin synthase family protein [Acidimicrobiaceae bacterium]
MSGGGSMWLLGNGEFVEDLHRALRSAERRVLVQVMTFDGDASGLAVADLLAEAAGRGVEVRLLVDCFALRYVSDRKATDPEVQAEAAETKAMFARLEAAGVSVTFTQPFGPVLFFGLSRNHKKLYLVDDHAYLGGINISDHNFAWRDFMIRTADPATVDTLAEDFACTERGERQSLQGHIITNAEIEPAFEDVVNGATRSLVLASPYSLDIGIVKLLERAQAPDRTVVTSRENNFRLLRAAEPYIWGRLVRSGVELRTYPYFFHARFLLADDDRLLVGSSNFSRHSFRCNQEVCLLITDTDFIADFKDRMLADTEPLERALPVRRSPTEATWGWMVARFYFHVIVGAAQVVAPFAPTLARR